MMVEVPEVVLVPVDSTTEDLCNAYLDGKMTYDELCDAFTERSWKTTSLYEYIVAR